MPVGTVYHQGLTLGCPPSSPPKPPERTMCKGWSLSAIRRNRNFLYSVDSAALVSLGLRGLAFTGTVHVCPDTSAEWSAAIHAFFHRLRRLGLVCGHWVIEWQRRAVPHLHMALWFPASLVDGFVKGSFARLLVGHWMASVGQYWGARDTGQHCIPIYNAVGWNQYVSKHAARGLNHYQRNPENIPPGWRQTGTGRVWGKIGDWPVIDPVRVDLSVAQLHKLRRIVRGYRLADSRAALAGARNSKQARQARRRIVQARGMLKARGSDPEQAARLSSVRGVSEWIPDHAVFRCLAFLASFD